MRRQELTPFLIGYRVSYGPSTVQTASHIYLSDLTWIAAALDSLIDTDIV